MVRHCERYGDMNYQAERPDNRDMGLDIDKYKGVDGKYRSSRRSMKRCKCILQKIDERCGGIGDTIRHILMDFPLMDERFWLEQMLFHAHARKRVKDQMPVHF